MTEQMKVGLFIDGANLHRLLTSLNVELDYKQLLSQYRQVARVIRALYFTALFNKNDHTRRLCDYLVYNGFTLVAKKAKERFDQRTGEHTIKGNVDVEIAVHMLEMAPYLDEMVLFSGDGDFVPVVRAVQRKGVVVSVVSSTRATPRLLSDQLHRQANRMIELTDLGPNICRSRRGAFALSDRQADLSLDIVRV